MKDELPVDTDDLPIDEPLLNSRQLRNELGNICEMTSYRWVKAGILHEPIKINGRNYWFRRWVNAVKTRGAA